MRVSIRKPHTGQQQGIDRDGRVLSSRELFADSYLVVVPLGPVIPAVYFELLADLHELIDDLGPVVACWLFRCAVAWVQVAGRFMRCPVTDTVEDAAGDLLGLAEFTDDQRIRLGLIEVDFHRS